MQKFFIKLKSLDSNEVLRFIIISIVTIYTTIDNLRTLSSLEKDLAKILLYLLHQVLFVILVLAGDYILLGHNYIYDFFNKTRKIYYYCAMMLLFMLLPLKKLYPPNALLVLPSLAMIANKTKYSFLIKFCVAIYGLLALSAMIYVFLWDTSIMKISKSYQDSLDSLNILIEVNVIK